MKRRPTVLVVDDEESILAAFDDFLHKEQCTMVSARTVEDALKLLESERIHLVITDIRLRFKSGVTFLLQVKAARPDLPFIVITGYPESLSEHELKAYGADYFFLKPLDIERLRDAIRKSLSHRNVTSTLQF